MQTTFVGRTRGWTAAAHADVEPDDRVARVDAAEAAVAAEATGIAAIAAVAEVLVARQRAAGRRGARACTAGPHGIGAARAAWTSGTGTGRSRCWRPSRARGRPARPGSLRSWASGRPIRTIAIGRPRAVATRSGVLGRTERHDRDLVLGHAERHRLVGILQIDDLGHQPAAVDTRRPGRPD